MKEKSKLTLEIRIVKYTSKELREKRVFFDDVTKIAKLRWDRGFLGRLLRRT